MQGGQSLVCRAATRARRQSRHSLRLRGWGGGESETAHKKEEEREEEEEEVTCDNVTVFHLMTAQTSWNNGLTRSHTTPVCGKFCKFLVMKMKLKKSKLKGWFSALVF